MPSTPAFSLPYPAPDNTPDVPYYMQQLAEAVEDSLTPAAAPPACALERATNLPIPTGAYTRVTFDAMSINAGGMGVIGTGATQSRITISEAGVYAVSACIVYSSGSTGGRYAAVYRNGSIYRLATMHASVALSAAPCISALVPLAAGDYLELYAYQSSGGSVNLNSSPYESTFLSAHRVRS